MIKTKWATISVFVLFAVLGTIMLSGCAKKPDIAAIDAEETYPESPVALEIIFTQLDNMIAYADSIAEVEVTDSDVILLDGFPQTHSTASVLTVMKGDMESGGVIEVVEEGGTTEQGEAIVGVPVMQPGEEYILFLLRSNEQYYIAGAFQGRFIERSGYVFQQATSDVKLTDYEPLSVEAFMKVAAGG
jgi:hypothetical protein